MMFVNSFKSPSRAGVSPIAKTRISFQSFIARLGLVACALLLTCGAACAASITLAWDPSPDAGVASYKAYYGGASGVYTNSVITGTATSTTISGLVNGRTYYFAVTAVTAAGVESPFSAEIAVLVSGASTVLPTVRLQRNPARQMQVTAAGSASAVYDVMISSNLVTWTRLASLTNGSGGLSQFTDLSAPTNGRRFYRLKQTSP
jgi:hypothetical protein